MSNDIQPEIRFPGFTEAWEQRKFECLLDKKDGVRRGPFGSALKKEFFVSNSNFVVYEQQNAIYDNYETRYKITEKKYNELIKFKLEPGDFIMSGAGTIGRISRVPKQIKPGVFNQALIRLRINKEITDSEYFIQFIRADFMQRKLTGANPGSAITNLVPMSEVKKWIVQFPILEEQKKIGNFFKQLDDTIALQQRKLDLLKETKKGFLQKMFPKNGAKVPEIRFPGFTEDWEQRKLGELATIVRGASPRPIQDPKWFDTESDVGWLRIADVTEQDGRIYYLEQHISKLGQEKTRVLVEPHLLLSIAATVGKPVVNYVKTGVHDGFLIFLNAIFDREFMFQWLEMFRPKWQKYGQPGSQVNLNSELVRNQEILIPNNEEQQKIGSFFKQLDDTIALHQRELDVLKETKKGFLQKMFV
ncbi:type I restriction-modification system specificity subunit S [Enterococcus faecium]|uniref:restriction endonuclease subunit S n=1 Tax=Enterococcus faecium TaxID=1352 RepID=UPI0010AFE94D|nr:restriction endonuclease subunit S [Enterococcus faecium]BBI25682.1 type I restriction-modification system specificity subunit S [Enterococcus faecium]